jgi:hypothetical protein
MDETCRARIGVPIFGPVLGGRERQSNAKGIGEDSGTKACASSTETYQTMYDAPCAKSEPAHRAKRSRAVTVTAMVHPAVIHSAAIRDCNAKQRACRQKAEAMTATAQR